MSKSKNLRLLNSGKAMQVWMNGFIVIFKKKDGVMYSRGLNERHYKRSRANIEHIAENNEVTPYVEYTIDPATAIEMLNEGVTLEDRDGIEYWYDFIDYCLENSTGSVVSISHFIATSFKEIDVYKN